jgi:PAS domain S-box-containing protein
MFNMKEIIVFNLENDQDLVLGHRRSMQLGEMCGLGLVSQTSFATAVSEVARFMIENGNNSILQLCVKKSRNNRPMICASVNSPSLSELNFSNDNFQYARKLVSQFEISGTSVTISSELPKSTVINQALIEKCKKVFQAAQAISPYEEVKRKNAELQQLADNLVESENRYQELTGSLPLMMFILASDHHMLYANQWFLEFSGKSLANLKETNWFDWVRTHHMEIDFGHLQSKLQEKQPFQLEVRLSSGNRALWHLLSLTPQLNANGELLQWFGFIVNIHAQKVVDETLKDNQELRMVREMMEIREKQLDETILELNRSNQELARYAYVASHDLQEPIRKTQLLADMVLNKFSAHVPAEALDLLKRLKGSSDRMQLIVKDLLNYSRLNSGTVPLNEKIELSKLVQLAATNLELMIREKEAVITVKDSCTITGNTLQLLSLFQNLLANAIKFTPPGTRPSVVITASAVERNKYDVLKLATDKSWLCLQVIDNGIGFEQRYAERIFEVFQRLHSHKQYEGTGIGLSVCKKIVELHGGVILAESTPGNGANFIFYLPGE